MTFLVFNLATIQHFLVTTPVQDLAAYMLLAVGWIPIAGILIWGGLEVWLDRKQEQYLGKQRWLLLAVNVPKDSIQTPKGMENFFNNLMGSKSAIHWNEKWLWGKFQTYFCFEIVSNGGNIQFYIRCVDKYRDLIEAALYAQYPEAQISEAEDYVDMIPKDYPNEEYDLWGSEIVASAPAYLPIKTWEMFEHQGEKDQRFKDPLLPMLEMMGKMQPGEHFWIQIMIMPPEDQDWAKDGIKFIEKLYGKEPPKPKSFIQETVGWIPNEVLSQITNTEIKSADQKAADDFRMFKITPTEREQIDLVNLKIAKFGWLTKIRFVYAGKTEVFRKGTIASMSKGIFHQYAHLSANKLGLHLQSTPKDEYFYMRWQMPSKQMRLIKRYADRSFTPGSTPYILNSEELATLFHFPAADARTPVLTTVGARRAEAPVELGFAHKDTPTLMNVERTVSDATITSAPGAKIPTEPAPLVVPTPKLPTTAAPREQTIWHQAKPAPISEPTDIMPQAGMPAPLPPGLDLSNEVIEDSSAPSDLPT